MSSESPIPTPASVPLLTVEELSFAYIGQPQPTLQAVNLQLYPGELVVVSGATGSGKSTLLNCLTGIAPEHTGGKLTGEIRYRGEAIQDWSIRLRSQIMGIMLQNVETQLFTDQVWEELVFGLENWNVPPPELAAIAQAAIDEFNLSTQQYWSIRQLSAGQKQRLLLACLLTRHPDILILDEPFAFLDTAAVQLLLALLQKRVQQGQTVLLIEHRLELIREMCDRNPTDLNVRGYRIEAGQVTPVDQTTLWSFIPSQPPVSPTANPTPETHWVLETRDLSWGGYPPFPDLHITAGTILLLQGENGCGKTTLLKLLSGLLKPATGQLILQGQEVTRKSVIQIAKTVGFVLQNPNHQLFAESVEAELKQPRVDTAYAQDLLENLNLSHRADQHPHALSQGQKRRLALGAVLARQPQICLLDEIMVGQDPTSLSLMLKALKSFTEAGGTLIFTSHDPGVVTVLNPQIVTLPKQSVRPTIHSP